MGPLEGITVLDLTRLLSGPFGTMTLCDLGADVIKVERPPFGDIARSAEPLIGADSAFFLSLNRGKQSIAIDLGSEAGHDLFLSLAEQVDVVAENFRPGVMDGLGLGWEDLSARNPRLIYASVSGFGQTGPDRERPALDIIAQAEGGLMSVTGEPDGPPDRAGLSLGDIAAGLYMAIGVLAALHERERSGLGQAVDISMLDCQIALLESAFTRYFATGKAPTRLGSRHPYATPFEAFPTGDGYLAVALSGATENQWALFCAAIDRVDLIDDPRFETNSQRTEHHAELEAILGAILPGRTAAEWVQRLRPLRIPCGPVNTIAQAAENPQIRARSMLVDVPLPAGGSLRVPNTPVKLSRTPATARGSAPGLGEHANPILSRLLNLDEGGAAKLREDGALS
jgi:crotonobetainyl-CoA:carnitine CoA-transferase CaiB-like acyl-CoA transferase